MNPDTLVVVASEPQATDCPRCGLPEQWQLKWRVRAVCGTFLAVFVGGLVLGRLIGGER